MGVQHPIEGVKTAVVEYELAKDGGASATYTLRASGQLGGEIPADSIIVNGVLDVLTALTGAGVSCALQAEAANDLVASSVISGAPWSTTGRKVIIPQGAASSVKLTTNKTLKLVVSGGTITAGKFRLYVEYY